MHTSMSVLDRLENALCGYVLLDLFKLLSGKECRRRSLPTNSLWMAVQTHRNLQYVVMGFVSALMGKDVVGNPFRNSHHRWTELPIEMWFGRLRQRATSAAFNAKQYWSHAAAEMMRTKKLGVGESDSTILRPPTDEEFNTASKRALKSAIRLAAWTADVSEDSLQAAYAECAPSLISALDASEALHDWERDEKEDWENFEDWQADREQDAEGRWRDLLQHVRQQAAASLEADEQTEQQDQEPEKENQPEHSAEKLEEPAAPDEFQTLLSMPDGTDLKDLCEETEMNAEEVEAADLVHFSCTLREAMASRSDSSSVECFDKLWRLIMYLRYWRGGMDLFWVKNPRASRKKAATKHWYRCLGSLEKLGLSTYSLVMSCRFLEKQVQ